jgi:hypothetical protein
MPETTHRPDLTVAAVARRYRVGEDKVRMWIKRGEIEVLVLRVPLPEQQGGEPCRT